MPAPTPRRLLLGVLLLANGAMLGLLLFVRPPAQAQSPTLVRVSDSPDPRTDTHQPTQQTEIDSIRQRLTEKLCAALAARDEQLFLSEDPPRRLGREGTLDRITIDYSELFRELNLSPAQTRELKTLLTKRAITSTYYVTLPPEVAAAGVPDSFEFGRPYWAEQILARFGADTLARIEAFEPEIPLRKETTELTTALALARRDWSPAQVESLQKILRRFPVPDSPPAASSDEARAAHFDQRLHRVEQLISAADKEFGSAAGEVLADYLFENEQRFASVRAATERLATLRRKRADLAGEAHP